MKAKHITALSIGLAVLPLQAQFRPRHHYALTSAQVARSLAKTFAERGIQIADSQVSLPANVVATDPEPVLDVGSVQSLGHLTTDRLGETSSAVKLTCRAAATCLPFYAIVTLPHVLEGFEAQKIITPHADMPIPQRAPAEYTIRSGKHATLMMDDGSSHIQMNVVTLENGVAGHTIRVSSADHKQVYLAEVISDSVVKGSF